MAHTELELRERRVIKGMLNAKVPVSKIATELGRHRSSVYRETRRNRFFDDSLPYLGWRTPTEAFRDEMLKL